VAEKKGKSIQEALESLAQRLDECRAVKPGDIEFHLSGESGGDYRIGSGRRKSTISSGVARETAQAPLLEVWGDADTIRAIIEGEKDPVKQFLAGRMRVRGNIRYLSDLGVELGILEKPL
jgi:hypothetical protein